jgi:hypothetical protein
MMREVSHQHPDKAETATAPPSALSGEAREKIKQALRM